MNIKPISSPHISSARRVDDIMRKVIFALLPALGFGIVIFGWSALFLTFVTVSSALIFEAICLKLKGAFLMGSNSIIRLKYCEFHLYLRAFRA